MTPAGTHLLADTPATPLVPPTTTPVTTGPSTTPTGPAAGEVELSAPVLAFVLALAVVGFGVARAAGVFRRGSVEGPGRFPSSSRASPLLAAFLAGVGAWILAPAVALQFVPETGRVPGQFGQPLADDVAILVTLAGATAALLTMLFVDAAQRPSLLPTVGLSPLRSGPAVKAGLVAIVVAFPGVMVVSVLTEQLWRALGLEHPREHDLLRILGEAGDPTLKLLVILAAAVAAPVVEELLFRGHLQTLALRLLTWRQMTAPVGQGFEVVASDGPASPPASRQPVAAAEVPASPPAWARWTAIVIASALFALVHPWWMWPPIFFLSVCLGYVYERTGSLLAPVVLHAAFNTLSIIQYKALMGV